MMSGVVSALHLLALAIGLPSVFLRGRALAGPLDGPGLRRLFAADTWWGVAALVWIATGLARAFAGLEKGTQFYLASPLFWVKMSLLGAIILLEIWPMTTFIRWRIVVQQGGKPSTRRARQLWIINRVEMLLAIATVFVASFMARGFGLR